MRQLRKLYKSEKNKTLSVTIALMMLVCLTACTQAVSEYDALIMPDVVEYPLETQRKAKEELSTNDVPTLMEIMKDCKIMRDQARAGKDT